MTAGAPGRVSAVATASAVLLSCHVLLSSSLPARARAGVFSKPNILVIISGRTKTAKY